MCGIAGILTDSSSCSFEGKEILKKMIARLRHRGPDGFGFYIDGEVGLAHSRLSIIDLDGGWQPMCNEDESVWITFNGEIFNYIELRDSLRERGHTFRTSSDTETIIHLYEEYGSDCLKYLNGQFAFGIWDRKKKVLFLARDRMGIRPLYYSRVGNDFCFASEMKAIFEYPGFHRSINAAGLDQIFTLWTTVPPVTVFDGINELPAGHCLEIRNGKASLSRYWDVSFKPHKEDIPEEEWTGRVRDALVNSVRLQLRADVPVAAYLSGGLDSSVIAALVKKYTGSNLKTFSVAFEDKEFDESSYQMEMAKYLGTDNSVITCSSNDIGKSFQDVVWHMETPVLRTAPVPLYFLSKLVRESGIKVVLTGEGADEIFAGYDIFKEAKIRQFWARFPDSKRRPLLLQKMYPYLSNSPSSLGAYTEKFFDPKPMSVDDPFYAHYPRWKTTSAIKLFYSDSMKDSLRKSDPVGDLGKTLSPEAGEWDYLSKAQYVEMKTLLSGYLLSSQGDRVAMANSIEGRFPFLDHEVVELCANIPPRLRIRGLKEKFILRESMKDLLPEQIGMRTKQPYRAPDSVSFFSSDKTSQGFVGDILSSAHVRKAGFFNPAGVGKLLAKARSGNIMTFKDNMSFMGIISTQLLYLLFIDGFAEARQITDDEIKISIDRRNVKWN